MVLIRPLPGGCTGNTTLGHPNSSKEASKDIPLKAKRCGASRTAPLYMYIPLFIPSGRGTTVALALRFPGDFLPWGPGGDNRVQICDGLAPTQSCTPLSLYKCGSLAARANGAEGVRETVAGLSGHSLTAKGGNRGCWSGCLGGGSAGDQTDRRAITAFLCFISRAQSIKEKHTAYTRTLLQRKSPWAHEYQFQAIVS